MRLAKRIMLLIITLNLSLFLPGCNYSDDKKNAEEKQNIENTQENKIKIRSIPSSQQEDRWIMDFKAIQEECDRQNIELIYDTAEMDADRQASQCLSMLSKGIQMLILIPYDAQKAAKIVEEAHKKNIKVISYDRLIIGADVDMYITFDNEKVGELMGKALTQAVPKGNYVFLKGAPNDRNCFYVTRGAMKYIQPLIDKGDVKIVFEDSVIDWKPENALNLMNKAIEENPNNIHGVFAPNDATAGACIEALTAHNLISKIPVTGQDSEISAVRRILSGTQLMTIFKDTRELGKKSIEIAKKMVNGETVDISTKLNNEKIDVPTIYLTPEAITKQNIDDLLINSGYLSRDSVYAK